MARLRIVLAASAAVLALGTAQAHAETPRAAVQGEIGEDLRQIIERAIGETAEAPTSRFEARRRAREAGEDAIAVLRSEGYYGHLVEADVVGGEEAQSPQPVVRVTPGPLFHIADPQIAWTDAQPQDFAVQAAREAMDLPPGAPGRAALILDAEGRIVAAIQQRGYADAATDTREVVVDHADQTVRPTFRIVAGPLVKLDGTQLETKGRTNPLWVQRLSPWTPGEVYTPQAVAELERRLLDTGVYDAVTVALQPAAKATPEGLRPVQVTLVDRPPRTLEVGAGYSTSEGVGLDARWTRYNRLRRADTLTILTRLAQIEQRLEAKVILPHWRRPQRTLTVTASIFNELTDAYDQTGAGIVGDLTRRFGKTSFLTLGAGLDVAKTADKALVGGLIVRGLERDIATATLLGAFSWDQSNDPLDPTRGWRIEARAEPTLMAGDVSLGYLKTQGQGSIYYPFGEDDRTVAAARVRLGVMLGGQIPDVPASRRFYAGGGGSVRGYSYQAIGPRLPDNTPEGGLSLFESSFEVRHRLTERWGVVGFVDVGGVGDDVFPTGADFSAGAGLGVRYDLGFGPIRADVAIPLDKREGDSAFQIYISIGQSF